MINKSNPMSLYFLHGSFPVFKTEGNQNLRLEKYFPDFLNEALGWKNEKKAKRNLNSAQTIRAASNLSFETAR